MNETSREWTKAKVEQLVKDGIEESLNLEYKSCGALGKTDEKKKEISKDVSSFANSDGGAIIYGIKECDQNNEKYSLKRIELDEGFDPADISKEWLEQVIVSNIRPKIDNLLIYPIPRDIGNKVIYVVDIPKGETAHQAKDHRYYKRNNFQSVSMEDYEIRDVMNRKRVPDAQLVFTKQQVSSSSEYELHVNLINKGETVIKYFRVDISLPLDLVTLKKGYFYKEKFIKHFNAGGVQPRGVNYGKFSYKNPSEGSVIFPNEEFILLPSDVEPVRVLVFKYAEEGGIFGYSLMWKIYADNMPFKEGAIDMERIENKKLKISI